jgi:hypothetical protein
MKLMSLRKTDLGSCLKRETSWEEFVKGTLELLESSTGKMILSFEQSFMKTFTTSVAMLDCKAKVRKH